MSLLNSIYTLGKYKLENAAIRAKNLNVWLSDRNLTSFEPAGTAAHPVNFKAEALIEREDVNLATAVRVISTAVAWLPFKVYQSDTDDKGTEIFVEDADHDFNALFREPNYVSLPSEIKTHMSASSLLTGNSFMSIEEREHPDPMNRLTHELWPISPDRMFLLKDNRSRPTGYKEIVRPGEEKIYELEEVVHMRTYNINDPMYGRSGVEPLKRQLWTEYQAEMMNLGFFTNDGTPRSVLIPETSVMPEQAEQIEQYYRNRANPDDKNRLQIMPVSGKFQTIQPSQTDMEFYQMRKYHRERTFAMLGIPPFLGGVMEFANYANALIQEQSFWRHTMIPHANLIADVLTRRLLWVLYGDKTLVIRPDFSQVEALQGDQVKKAQKNSILVRAGIITRNEARSNDYNLEKLDQDGANDLLIMTGSAQGNTATAAPAKEPAKSLDGLFVQIQSKTASGVVFDTKAVSAQEMADAWNKFDAIVQLHEPKIAKVLVKFYKKQAKRFLSSLYDVTVEGRMMSNLFIHTKGHLDFFVDMELEDAELEAMMEPIILDLVDKVGTNASGAASLMAAGDIGVAFDVENPKVQIFISNITNRIVDTNKHTFAEIQKILRRAFANGESVNTVAKLITAKFKEFQLTRSKMIARTEMTGIANGASQIAYTGWGATHKTWVATLDDLTRDYHVQYNGERVAINDYYKFGPEPLFHPGDYNATLAGNVINCRCTEIYDFEPLTALELSDLELAGLAA